MTPELRQARAGKMTASKAAVVMGGLDTSGLKSYVMDLAWERVYGIPEEDGYQNAAMLRGKELEASALAWYEFETDSVLDVDPNRTIDHPVLQFVAATPDALCERKVIEAKSPLHKAWMEVKRTSLVPSEYRWQCRWQMWCSQLEECDFVCWHPLPGGLIVPFSLAASECDEMLERVAVVEKLIQKWVCILTEQKAAA